MKSHLIRNLIIPLVIASFSLSQIPLVAAQMGATVSVGRSAPLSCSGSPYNVGGGDTTALINAINCANASAGDDVINLTNSTYTLTSGSVSDTTTGLPDIVNSATAGTLTINGNQASITRSGASSFRLFYVNSGGDLTLNDLLISNGSLSSGGGGGIFNGGTLTLNDVRLVGNAAPYAAGIANSAGVLTIRYSELSGNTATSYGGALINYSGTLNLIDSTVSGNSVTTSGGSDGGGALDSYGTGPVVRIVSSSIANNTAGNATRSGIWYETGTLSIQNSIVANNNGANNCQKDGASFIDSGNNLDNGTSCGFSGMVGQNTDPMIGSLTHNGGFTKTLALPLGSPAINAGNSALAVDEHGTPLTTDQRGMGYLRIQAGTVDIGAFEYQCPSFPHTVGSGDTADLIWSMTCANSNGVGTDDVINLTHSTYTLTAVNNTTLGGNGLPFILDQTTAGTLTIHGSGATIQRSTAGGTPAFRLFAVDLGADLTLNDLLLSNGSPASGGGGALNSQGGAVALNHVRMVGNAAIYGGAIASAGTLTIVSSELSGNTATNYGGAVGKSDGILNLINSTVSGNSVTAGGSGGGAFDIYTGSPTVTIINSTIANNTAGNTARSGIWLEAGTLTIQNSIVANNSGKNNCAVTGGTITDNGNNLDNGATCGFGGAVGQNTNPMLGGLTNNGGFTRTRALQAGSPAINAGDNAKAVDEVGDPLTTDQRGAGFPRIVDSTVDIGAYEANICYTLTTAVTPGDSGSVLVETPDNCSGSGYLSGTEVLITAVPSADYSFDHWSGDASGSSDLTAVTMDGNKSVTAHFSAATVLTVGHSFDDNGGHIAYSGNWGTSSGGSYFGGTMHFTGEPGASLSFPLMGTAGNRLEIFRSTGPDRGNMQVCIGAGVCQTFSNYSIIPLYRQPLTILLPNAGSFTITITNQGTSGQYLDFDLVALDTSPNALTEGDSFQDDRSSNQLQRAVDHQQRRQLRWRNRQIHGLPQQQLYLPDQRLCRRSTSDHPHGGTGQGANAGLLQRGVRLPDRRVTATRSRSTSSRSPSPRPGRASTR